MTEFLLLGAAAIAVWLYGRFRKSQHPQRLYEIEKAARTQAELWLHRNKDVRASDIFTQQADALRDAQYLVKESKESVQSKWAALRSQVLNLTDEDFLKAVDLYYCDRQPEYKAAVYDLVSCLDRKAAQL